MLMYVPDKELHTFILYYTVNSGNMSSSKCRTEWQVFKNLKKIEILELIKHCYKADVATILRSTSNTSNVYLQIKCRIIANITPFSIYAFNDSWQMTYYLVRPTKVLFSPNRD